MDLDRGLLEMIDEYISDAMASTGTRRAPRQTQPSALVVAPEPELADLEPQTEPFGTSSDDYESYESYEAAGSAFVIDPHDADDADLALLGQVAQQLAYSESAIEPLPRARAPRSTTDLDDEVTAIVARPPSKPL